MSKVLRLNDLPTVRYLEGEAEKYLDPLDGRVILTLPSKIATADGTKNGYRKRYSHTPAELTVLLENLRNDYDSLSARTKSFIDLPTLVQEFMRNVQNDMEKYRKEQTAMLQHVSDTLDNLLAGKAKPSGDMMQFIQSAFAEYGTRIRKVEERLSSPQESNPSQK